MNVDKLLDGLTALRTCTICSNEQLARMIARWLDRKADPADNCMVPLEVFVNALRATLPECPSAATIRRHVINCLRRDHRTGAPLDG